jgi:GNAT superfamily N-acetyltransferase
MEKEELLALFDQRIRRECRADAPGDVVERVGDVVRQVPVDADAGWTGVVWSGLDENGADAAIAEQVAYFRGLGRAFEWKLYSHDRPADLGERLAKAGLEPEETEALMVAEIDALPQEPVLPEGTRIEPVRDLAGVELMIRAHREAFGRPSPRLEEYLRQQVTQGPDAAAGGELTALVVMAGDRPVCAARMDFHEGTPFASLWGGGTAPDWRGRGIYRATVAYRARLAAERGYRFLQVDASDDSRPILARLGFSILSTTTPYNFEP